MITELTARGPIDPWPTVTIEGNPFMATKAVWTLYVYDDGQVLACVSVLDDGFDNSANEQASLELSDWPKWPIGWPQPPTWLEKAGRWALLDASPEP